MDFRLHNHDGIAVWERKHDFDTGTVKARRAAERIIACIKDIPTSFEFTHPGCVNDGSGFSVKKLDNVAGDAAAGIERGERDIELLKAAAENKSEEPAEGAKRPRPFRLNVKIVICGMLVEVNDAHCNSVCIEGQTCEVAKIVKQTASR